VTESEYEVLPELDEPVPEVPDLGDDEPVEQAEDAEPTTYEEATAEYDADLDDEDDDNVGQADDSDREAGGDDE
jgi:hypothetical protein